MRCHARLALSAVLLVAAIAPAAGGAQQVSDSARTAVLDRLKALARAPGLDSTLLVDDSVLNAQRDQQANRAGGASGPDSVATALLGLPGYSVTRYQSAGAEFFAQDRTLSLRGAENRRATVSQDGFELTADSAIYFDEASGRVRSEGAAEFSQPGGDPVLADQLLYDLNQGRGSAFGAVTTYTEGANWTVRGDMTSVTPVESWGLHATMTSCELEEPHYHFRTGEVKFVNSNWFVARNVTLRFADVPVMWLPFIAQGLGSGRASGLLPVRFSVNDIVRSSSGYSRRISNLGFYWAMSDYTDMSLSMDWFSDRFVSVNGGMGFFWAEQFLRGNFNYRQYWPSAGGRQLAFNGQADWDMNERTKIAISAAYTTSEDFVRENSFDPRELTQTINSQGGLNRRFDWGSLNIGANRQQHLSDDRVVMKLPTASLSLSPITFLRASGSNVNWYNNVTWSGGMNYSRGLTDYAPLTADQMFGFGTADNGNTTAGVNSSFTMGGLSFSQTLNLTENSSFDVPLSVLPYDTTGAVPEGIRDISQSDMRWSMALDYQQNLIGSLTLTPRMSYGGNLLRSDTIDAASGFVSGPKKFTFGIATKADFYKIYGGFGNFSAIRHKIATQVSYDLSPAVEPTSLQERVFRGSRFIQATNRASLSINNTWEAKVKAPETDSTTSAQADSIAAVAAQEAAVNARAGDGPRPRQQQEQVITLLGLTTSAVQYDFVADSTGRWQDGFQTTILSNQITSDYLRGLSLSVDWDLFETGATGTGTEGEPTRRFDPQLSRLNMGFSLGARSGVFRWLSRLTGGTGELPDEPEQELDENGRPVEELDLGEASIVPRTSDPFSQVRDNPFDRRTGGGGGGWSATFNYSLQRPRAEGIEGNQMLTANLRFEPTDLWSVTWRTSYDVNQQAFLDHIVRLSRDLHRWEANFDFRQTLTGNWTFQFAVALKDNRDLKFDYEQRSLVEGTAGFPR